MTSKSMLVQVRMPPRLVQILDRLSEEGIYSNRSEAILDGVRRLALAFETQDPLRQALLKSFLGKTGKGSIAALDIAIDRQDIMIGVKKVYGTDSIDEILAEVRR